MHRINLNNYHAVASFGLRVRFVVLHYTAQKFVYSVQPLTGKSVSAHKGGTNRITNRADQHEFWCKNACHGVF